MIKKEYTFIDLFAGAGGLSEGFIRAGFKPIAHIEMKKEACDTLRTRAAFHYLKNNNQLDVYKDYLFHKQEKEDGSKLWNQVPQEVIDTVIQSEIGERTIASIFEKLDLLIGERKLDLIIGGPPCQAYSVAGRARKGEAMASDPRNELYKFYVQFLDRYKPKMFVFENVLGIRTAKGGEPFRDLQKRVRELDNCNYEIQAVPQIASDFGVLQRRQRMIIIGWRKSDNGKPTKYGHYPNLDEFKIDNQYQTLRDLFSDLPTRVAGDGKLCECVKYTKPISEMTYLQKYEVRNNDFDFTTQHISRPNNLNDREIYCWAVKKFLKKGKQLSYSKGFLDMNKQGWASDVAFIIKNNRQFSAQDKRHAMFLFELVCKHNIELLEEADTITESENQVTQNQSQSDEITLELIQQMVDWDKRRRVLDDWKWKVMKDVVDGKKEFTDRMKYAFYLNLQALKKKGFPN